MPEVRTLGSIGQADLTANADLAAGILDDLPLAPGEGLALLNNNAFSVGLVGPRAAPRSAPCSVRWRRRRRWRSRASPRVPPRSIPAWPRLGPYEGLTAALGRSASTWTGARSSSPGHARNLQDPLSFRNTAHVLGAARDALAFARRQISMELNAAQGNPSCWSPEDRVISVANFEALPIAPRWTRPARARAGGRGRRRTVR